ncbi:hypothetical protein Q1695_011049 [Nippostrongylus brasiliensis]|nr:hypothetical protein Q1695_011049 [Nippostrongylus brasiliensis]
MPSSDPPPYPGLEEGNDATLKDNTVIPSKVAETRSNQLTHQKTPVAGPAMEMGTLPSVPSTGATNTNMVPNTPLPYATAPNTPLPSQNQFAVPPYAAQQAQPLGAPLNGGMAAPGMPTQVMPVPGVSAPGMAPCVGSPPSMPMGYGTAGVLPGMAPYPGAVPMQPMQPMYGQPPMAMNPAPAPQPGVGTNPTQSGGINLIVNTNASSGSNSDSKGGAGGTQGAGAGGTTPAPRPCPKCRLGYITRGQARVREMCIKALAYATVCCTCFLPLQLLKTNYVDKCTYCGEEYGFRGELFEKPKPPKT